MTAAEKIEAALLEALRQNNLEDEEADEMQPLPPVVVPLPLVVFRASAMYDENTGVMSSADVEISTARPFDHGLIQTAMAALANPTNEQNGQTL